jgi:hypothetical protein
MGRETPRIDLHSHTRYSDGTFTPAEAVALALERSLTALSISDHDSTEGLPEAFEAAEGTGLEIVPGVEFSTVHEHGGVHVLTYWPNVEDEEFQAELRRLRDDRYNRGERMVRILQDLGYPILFERVREIASGKNIGRPHVAQALVETGVVAEVKDAFSDEFIGTGGSGLRREARPAPAGRVAAHEKGGRPRGSRSSGALAGWPSRARPFDRGDGPVRAGWYRGLSSGPRLGRRDSVSGDGEATRTRGHRIVRLSRDAL